ncbi:MAG: OB-fold nucleic acid binding domain-containing protein [archaeon]|nr:OB-fold nucleic acid binding domain-containing protein [archaeon]
MIKIKIKELTVGSSDVAIEGTIIEKGELRNVNTRFGGRKVCNFVIEDDTGRINFSLWEDDIEKIKEGDKVSIAGSYVSEWNSQLQLNIPKSGSFEVSK